MGEVKEAGDLPEGDKVYLRKDILGYRVVYPLKNSDGTINWKNALLGNVRMLILMVLFISALLWIWYDVNSNYAIYKDKCELSMNSPAEFCSSLMAKTTPKFNLNLSGVIINGTK